MKVQNKQWQVRTLLRMRDEIEHQPLYQRGEVWPLDKQQLLIDSILRELDIPKVYLRSLENNALYTHQIVDGQQRLTAIWRYTGEGNDAFPLHRGTDVPEGWAGKHYSELSLPLQERILDFSIVIAEIQEATDEEVRELFARLQKGLQLNPPELRNSIRSLIGTEIRAMALTHPFYPKSTFSPRRYKHHDLTAHAFAVELMNGTREHDLKAPDLRQMYVEHAESVPKGVAKRVSHNLNYLREMLVAVPGCISRKWGFVDLYSVVSRNVDAGLPPAGVLANQYSAFEQERLRYIADPESLLVQGSESSRDLYSYIMAFKISAGEAKQLRARYQVLVRRLLSKEPKR